MQKLLFQNVNTNKLHDELIKAGIIPLLVQSTPPAKDETNPSPIRPETWITVGDDQVTATNAVVTAHDPTPLLKTPTTEEKLLDLQGDFDIMYAQMLMLQGVNVNV